MRAHELVMRIGRVVVRGICEAPDPGEIKTNDATGVDRVVASHHHATRTTYTSRSMNRPPS